MIRILRKHRTFIPDKFRHPIAYFLGSQKMRMDNEVLRNIGFAGARFWTEIRNLVFVEVLQKT